MKKITKECWIAIAVVTILSGFIPDIRNWLRPHLKTATIKYIKSETPALDLPLYQPTNQHTRLSLKNYRGQRILVHFFAGWCGHCQREHPAIIDMATIPNLKIIGVNINSSAQELKDFLGNDVNPYVAIGLDTNGEVATAWQVKGTPTSFLLDAQGYIKFQHEGKVTKDMIEKQLQIMERL